MVPFAQQGVTVDMQPLADADPTFDLSDVYPNMLNLGKVGEELHMIPSSYDVVTMYYNKTMFEEAGAPLPTAEWTWDDYRAACKTIKETTGNYCFNTAEPPTGINTVALVGVLRARGSRATAARSCRTTARPCCSAHPRPSPASRRTPTCGRSMTSGSRSTSPPAAVAASWSASAPRGSTSRPSWA